MHQLLTISALVNNQTMSSVEISELTKKRHDNVMNVIKDLIDKKVLLTSNLGEYKDSTGRTLPCYYSDKRDSLVIVARLSPEFTARVIDRWQELENAALERQFKGMELFNKAMNFIESIESEFKENAKHSKKIKNIIEQRIDATRVNVYTNQSTGEVVEYVTFKEVAKFLGLYNADDESDPKNKDYYGKTMDWLARHGLRSSLPTELNGELPREVMIPFKGGKPFLALTLDGFNRVVIAVKDKHYRNEDDNLVNRIYDVIQPLKLISSNLHNFQVLCSDEEMLKLENKPILEIL